MLSRQNPVLLVATGCVIGWLTFAATAVAQSDKSAPPASVLPERYQYNWESMSSINRDQKTNDLAKEGWEPVLAAPVQTGIYAVLFRKPLN